MSLCRKKIQQYLSWFMEDRNPKKIPGWGWGNADSDISILRLRLGLPWK